MRHVTLQNIVAAGLADNEIQLSYAIGVAQPTSVMVDTFEPEKLVMRSWWKSFVRTLI